MYVVIGISGSWGSSRYGRDKNSSGWGKDLSKEYLIGAVLGNWELHDIASARNRCHGGVLQTAMSQASQDVYGSFSVRLLEPMFDYMLGRLLTNSCTV